MFCLVIQRACRIFLVSHPLREDLKDHNEPGFDSLYSIEMLPTHICLACVRSVPSRIKPLSKGCLQDFKADYFFDVNAKNYIVANEMELG
mmetsp:Transcript_8036/g.16167  ORF Transcript_8036/g.16167 Transcript_8036/m.16167 type:complete len:90 (-) Transcript_8036:959-1228(-)